MGISRNWCLPLKTASISRDRKKMKLFILSVCIVASLAKETAEEKDVGLRAAARGANCGCQCDITTFKDKYGRINGNCKSTDKGAVWCYVKDRSTCTDLQTSTRFNKLWSFEACATPEPDSYECRGYNNGYHNGNGGYNNGNNNYPCLGGNCGNSGYNPGNSGYNPGNSGYNPGNVVTSYPCRGSNRGNSGFNSGNSGYNSGNSGYNPGNSGFNSGNSSGYGSNLRSGSDSDSITFGER